MNKRYEVQHYTICDGWVNTWQTDDEPETFTSFARAVNALDEHLDDTLDAYKRGDLSEPYFRDDFRIAEVL